ncbi:GTP cyclohydrolase, FolE2/MptA family [bacterium]|nr:GTP cyclohydrolase, FolE2/MptA family [bacterium]
MSGAPSAGAAPRLSRVGVKNITYPVAVLDRTEGRQHTVANVDMSVDLARPMLATEEADLVDILNRHSGEMTAENVPAILADMLSAFDAGRARIEFSFPYFVAKKAPVSGLSGLLEYECRILGEAEPGESGARVNVGVEVRVPVTILHPASVDPERHGSRNQRCVVTVALRFGRIIWIEDVINLVEECASSELYSLLKRPDERHVTLRAYENPRSHEEIALEVARRLAEDENIRWFTVESVSLESMHNHENYARLEWRREGA